MSPAEAISMKAAYEPETETLSVIFKDGSLVAAESDEGEPGLILDYNAEGNLISSEILDAPARISDTRSIEFQLTS